MNVFFLCVLFVVSHFGLSVPFLVHCHFLALSLFLERVSADESNCEESQTCFHGRQYDLRAFGCRFDWYGIGDFRKRQFSEEKLFFVLSFSLVHEVSSSCVCFCTRFSLTNRKRILQCLLFEVSLCFTRHSRFHMRFQFSSCILDDGVKFLIIRSNVVNSCQSTCNVHFGFSVSSTDGQMTSGLDVV